MSEIIHGDCLDVLRGIEDDSIDLLCTDPPYGYGFMGKPWDADVPSVEVWRECLRALKPGALAFVMSAPRSDVQTAMVARLADAGFRVDFTPLYWTYASGFPKAADIAKLVDKRFGFERERQPNPAPLAPGDTYGTYGSEAISSEAISSEAKALSGSYAGYQPKPAVEVVIVAMKPLSERTYVDQALENGKGVSWLDDCRIPFAGKEDKEAAAAAAAAAAQRARQDPNRLPSHQWGLNNGEASLKPYLDGMDAGRFPANLLVSDDAIDDGEGSYSRFFSLDAWFAERVKELPNRVRRVLPFLIVPKASKEEKDAGLGNTHPTVKPLDLMCYLVTLGSRAGDTVLDPFCGSGTTCIAAQMRQRRYVGIEREAEYVEIARARTAAVPPTLFDFEEAS